MGLFDKGQSLASSIGAVSTTFGAVGNALNYGSNLASSIADGSMSAQRTKGSCRSSW